MLKRKKPASVEDRYELGRSLQKLAPLESHGEWSPKSKRRNPVKLIEEQNNSRIPWLVPVRRGRMSRSAFSFYRGAARIMAWDLADTPVSGLECQICGDAHLANFGSFASPERNVAIDLNDFDETLPGPWEWDVKRLAASFIIAGTHNGFSENKCRQLSRALVKNYRKAMVNFAQMNWTDIWYDVIQPSQIYHNIHNKNLIKKIKTAIKKSKRKDHLHVYKRLTEKVDGNDRIRSEPPLIVPTSEFPGKSEKDRITNIVLKAYDGYRKKVSDDLKHLLAQFQLVDFAIKVVGVGSVGTLCAIILLKDNNRDAPFFLQVKQANKSVLEEHLPPSRYKSSGERVVQGQRLMQTRSDMYLGWNVSQATKRHYYWRQFKDWKGGIESENLNFGELKGKAKLDGWILARAHARSGDPVAISGYLGSDNTFDRAITNFAELYAKQNKEDYEAFKEAIRTKNLETKDI